MTNELNQIIQDAKSGRTAELIRSIDLSTKEGVEQLRTILSPFNSDANSGVEIPYEHLKENRILDGNGNLLFPFQDPDSTTEYSLVHTPLLMTEQLEWIKDKTKLVYPNKGFISPLDLHLKTNGHIFTHAIRFVADALGLGYELGVGKKSIEELLQNPALDSSKRLLIEIYIGGRLVAQSINGSLPSEFISDSWINDTRYPPRPEHPNSQGIVKLFDFNEKYFIKWNQVFLRYLSNLIQNPNYKVPEIPTNLSIDQIVKDASFMGRRYIMSQTRCMPYCDWNRNIKLQTMEKGEGNEFCKDIEDEINVMLARLKPYEQNLDRFIEVISFAKPSHSK